MQLVLNKSGVKLSVKDGLFKINIDDQVQNVSALKVKSIIMHKSALITTDAIFTAIENEVEILFFDNIGNPKGRIWSNKYGSISIIRKNQIEFSKSKQGAKWIVDLLNAKIENQMAIVLSLGKPDGTTDRMIDSAIVKMQKLLAKINALEYTAINTIAAKLRGYEGNCSKIYFEMISKHMPAQYKFAARSQHPAFDMFNSMLNYSYGILYSKIEGALVMAGIDPYMGVMHRDDYNKPVLVYDVIEKYRAWADYVVINLCMQQIMFVEFFDVENGVHYLNHHGKRILIQSFNDYFEDIVKVKTTERSRNQHIVLFAQKFATKLKNL
ncbi:MAG: CRISPR-associated endonuclease Cas1 [Bacteroidetes bacterium]|nr:MAG: CRISPR-associated endonuclease Cas1 [Bacteroidota bacterium]